MQDWVASEIHKDDSGCLCIQGWVTNEIQYDDAGCPCNQGWVALPLYFLFRSFSDLGRDPRRSTGAMFADPSIGNDCDGGGPGICRNGLLVSGMLKLGELLGGSE